MALLLAVVDEGLGAAFVGIHDLQVLSRLLNIPLEVTPISLTRWEQNAQMRLPCTLTRPSTDQVK
jgi:hypothetical protein